MTLSIHDMLGRQIAVLLDSERTAGSHVIPFESSRLASGMYFYMLRTGSTIETRKLMVIKPALQF